MSWLPSKVKAKKWLPRLLDIYETSFVHPRPAWPPLLRRLRRRHRSNHLCQAPARVPGGIAATATCAAVRHSCAGYPGTRSSGQVPAYRFGSVVTLLSAPMRGVARPCQAPPPGRRTQRCGHPRQAAVTLPRSISPTSDHAEPYRPRPCGYFHRLPGSRFTVRRQKYRT
jgi:hypothetical protein